MRLRNTSKPLLIRQIEEHEELGYRQIGAIRSYLAGGVLVFWVRMEL